MSETITINRKAFESAFPIPVWQDIMWKRALELLQALTDAGTDQVKVDAVIAQINAYNQLLSDLRS